jgi:hypothetical protein
MHRRPVQPALFALALLCITVLGAEEVQAQDAAPAETAVETPSEPEPKPVSGETLALEAAQVQSDHCADAYREDTTKAARSITAVGDVWARLSEQYEVSGESFLLYWRGVLAQCMDQEERGFRDLEAFVAESAESPLWAALVKDAMRRLRQLERKTARTRLVRRSPPRATGGPPAGIVLGAALAAGSLATGIAAADRWRRAIGSGAALELDGQRGNEILSLKDDLRFQAGENEALATTVLGAVSAGLGAGAVVAFIISGATASSSHAAIAPPLLLPTPGGAAVLWELRW